MGNGFNNTGLVLTLYVFIPRITRGNDTVVNDPINHRLIIANQWNVALECEMNVYRIIIATNC